jgi:Homeodomain-like domain
VNERVRVREIDDDEGRRLVRIIRRGSGSVVTWRRAQMVLLSAQGMDVPAIAKVAFTSEDRVRDVIRNFNACASGELGSITSIPSRPAKPSRRLRTR